MRDRADYLSAIGESWKEQTLLNIVRLRYSDAPTFLDVSSIISGYTLQGQVSAGAAISSDRTTAVPFRLGTIGAGAGIIDRPTISYTPMSGDRFTRSLLHPIPPAAIFGLVEAGFPADLILLVTIRALNSVFNRSSMGGRSRSADPRFYPLLEAFRRLQLSGAVSLRRERQGQDEIAHLILAHGLSEAVTRDLELVAATLNLQLGRNRQFLLTTGAVPRNEQEIAVLSRSMMEILLELGQGIAVPEPHVAAGRTSAASRTVEAEHPWDRPFVRIHAGPAGPADAFVAVPYRETWYWVEDGDRASKAVLSFLMLLFSLAETGLPRQAPVLTVPAN
ncbi:hypothetical protein DFH01_06825 [Falsiroseomonas bella]|uniref:Uncharacterized protein n=1 Tax=Falsiroseomonas bella TaxID=2184016 RepID=A0A317FKR2_9PROT|nr:hypothetical protein DFH01_06825 [Falsiroseomonas bella]